MARKAFQLLIQGTLPEERREELIETITQAVEKALLPLDKDMVWIDNQMLATFNPPTQNPAWVVVRGSLNGESLMAVVAAPRPEDSEAAGPSE